MAKPRNWHAVSAWQRKAGYHSGRRRPHLTECDDISEQANDEIDDEMSALVRLTAETEALGLYPWQRGCAYVTKANGQIHDRHVPYYTDSIAGEFCA